MNFGRRTILAKTHGPYYSMLDCGNYQKFSCSEETHMTLEQRLDNLERSNRDMRALVILLLAVTALFTMAARPTAPKVLEAEKIVLRDPNGNERGQLFANEKSWGLVLYTENGQQALGLIASTTVNGLLISDQNGYGRQVFTSDNSQTTWGIFHPGSKVAQIEITDKQVGAEIVVRDRSDVQRVELGVTDKGPGFALSDANGTMRTVLSDGQIATLLEDGKINWSPEWERLGPAEKQKLKNLMKMPTGKP
jgi:hypothetical protein